jgi:hypothetical protein
MKKLLFTMFFALLAGCGDDAVEKLEQRVDEFEDELEQVKRDQSGSRGRPRSVFELFGSKDVQAKEGTSLARSGEWIGLDKIIAEAIDYEKLEVGRVELGETLAYAPNQSPGESSLPVTYTGWVKETFDDGRIRSLVHYKDGKPDGMATAWYENGQRRNESNWEDGKLWAAVAWKPNGKKCPVTNVVNGNGVVVYYNDKGTEVDRETYRDGEYVRPAGEPAAISD